MTYLKRLTRCLALSLQHHSGNCCRRCFPLPSLTPGTSSSSCLDGSPISESSWPLSERHPCISTCVPSVMWLTHLRRRRESFFFFTFYQNEGKVWQLHGGRIPGILIVSHNLYKWFHVFPILSHSWQLQFPPPKLGMLGWSTEITVCGAGVAWECMNDVGACINRGAWEGLCCILQPQSLKFQQDFRLHVSQIDFSKHFWNAFPLSSGLHCF